MNKKINAVILCGGRSSRMGQNKSLLPFTENKTILDFQYEKLSEVFNKVYVSSKHEHKVYETILDNSTLHSPMIALASIFDYIKEDEIFVITVDTPLITQESILKIVDFYKENSFNVVVPKDSSNNVHNLCGVFSKNIKPTIDKCLKDDIHKINFLIKNTHHCFLSIDSSKEFLNINTKEDYEEAIKELNS